MVPLRRRNSAIPKLVPGGGANVARAAGASGGLDERFRGWGSEDVSFMHAVDTLYGKHKTSNNPVYHIWHPAITEAARKYRRLWEYQQTAGSNDFLAKKYRAASGDAEAMRKVVGQLAPERDSVVRVRLPGMTPRPAASGTGPPAAPAD